MPTDALGLTQTQAGFSAGSATLQNLLGTVAARTADRESIVSAIELDPALLVAVLPRRDNPQLKSWHENIPTALIEGMAIDAAMCLDIDADNKVFAAIRRGLVASELANRMSADQKECRLSAMIAEAVVTQGLRPDEIVGIPPLVVDATTFQDEPLGKLAGAPALVRIVAVSGRLLQGNDSVEPAILSQCSEVLGIPAERIEDARSGTAWQFEQITRRLPVSATTDRTSAARAAILYRAFARSGEDSNDRMLALAASYLFEARATLLFEAFENQLVSNIDGETISIAIEAADSLVASCYRSERIASSTGGDVHIVERQLLGRYEDCRLTAIPLGEAGVIASVLPNAANIPDALLEGFSDAAADLVTRTSASAVALDEIRHAVREIIHEVNNPLSIVQNYLRTLSLKLGDDHPAHADIDTISGEIMRASGLMQKFRHLGEPEALLLAETDVNSLVTDLGQLLREGDDRTRIDYHLDDTIPRLVLPKEALRQVVLNLLKNAVEALEGSVDPHIVVSTQGAVNLGGRHFIEIEISDNGPGMSVEERLALFDPGHSSTKGAERGYGLGIVGKLAGEMSAIVSCRENRHAPTGTTFQLLLPFSFQEQHRDKNKNHQGESQ